MSELNLNPNSTLARKNIVDIALGVGITTLSLAVSYGVVAMHKVGELMRGDQVQPNALPSQQPSDVEATSTN